MESPRRRLAGFGSLILLGFLSPLSATAGGFAWFGQGARGMGFAGAYVAQSDDPSAIFHNPAGLGFLKGKQLALGAAVSYASTDFTGAEPFPGSGVSEGSAAALLLLPAFDYSHQITERVVLGLGIHSPFGFTTVWRDRDTRFSGRFLSKRARVRSTSINPTLAYKIEDRLSVGAGIDVRLATLELERNVAFINPFTQNVVDAAQLSLASNTARDVGFNLGVLAKPYESLSLGLSYRHNVKSDFGGSANFALLPAGNAQVDSLVAARLPGSDAPVSISAEIGFPALAAAGASYRWNDWVVAAGVDFHRWASFDRLALGFEGRPDLDSVVQESYTSSRIYRIGLERRLSERWTARGGYFLDRTPIPVESISPWLPDSDRQGFAIGASLRLGSLRVEAANWLMLSKSRSTQGRSRDNYNGAYKNFANLFSITIGFGF